MYCLGVIFSQVTVTRAYGQAKFNQINRKVNLYYLKTDVASI